MQCQPARTPPISDRPVEIVVAGSCVRAFAQSAIRAGWNVVGIDSFADWDTRACGPTVQLSSPTELVEALLPYGRTAGIVVCGGYERHRGTLNEAINRTGIRWLGAPGLADKWDFYRRAKDCIVASGLHIPPTRRSVPPHSRERWLVKPRVGAGGIGIGWWNQLSQDDQRVCLASPEQWIFQRYTEGMPASAQFVTDDGGTRLVGTSLTNPPASMSRGGFGTTSAIGPVLLARESTASMLRCAEHLATEFSLRGLWGMDVILGTGERSLHVIELNARPTSTMDLYELASVSHSLIGAHVDCFFGRAPKLASPRETWAKSVVFWPGPGPLEIDERRHRRLRKRTSGRPRSFLADIPMPGTRIAPGHPLVTYYCRLQKRPLSAAELHGGTAMAAVQARANRIADPLFKWLSDRPHGRDAAGADFP